MESGADAGQSRRRPRVRAGAMRWEHAVDRDLGDRLARLDPVFETPLVVLANVAARGLGEFRRARRAVTGGAGKHDPLALGDLGGVETREGKRDRAGDV